MLNPAQFALKMLLQGAHGAVHPGVTLLAKC